MNKLLSGLLSLGLLVLCSCQQKVDVAREEAAIKEVFEAEKTAFFNQDIEGIEKFWVQDEKSKKIWLSAKGVEMIEGWGNINSSILKEVADTSWNRKLMTCSFSEYQIDVMGNSAWVTNKTNWKGTFKGQAMDANQSRISVLKKSDGNWKFALMAIYNFPIEKDTVH
jgi:ketosteroid isomerase-like protein